MVIFKKNMRNKNEKIRMFGLAGTAGVTENLYVYEYLPNGRDPREMIVVDCGVGFPEQDMYGVDLVIPDFSYLEKNKHKIKGIVITHGHEDHFGALPFLLKKIRAPIYASKLTSGFIRDKLKDHEITNYKLNVIDPEKDEIKLGKFRLIPFRVSHSVPDTIAFCIDTPLGKLFHVSDYKFDWTPVDGKPFNITKAAALASEGVLGLASDCLGSTSPGHTESERAIEGRIETIVEKATGQVYFTTISSNISRMQQAINVAQRQGRKVCLIGRSVVDKAEVARQMGYLKYPDDLVVEPKKARRMNKNQILYIISGSYGQPGSALYRIAMGEHRFLSVSENDTVIFSGDPAPPGSKTNVDFLVDRFFEKNVDVHYYDMQEDLHVSGHGSIEDIKLLFGIIKPKFFIPIGGTIRHMRAYSQIAQSMGAAASNIFETAAGEIVEFSREGARQKGKVEVKSVLVDGLGVGDVGNVVLRDRQVLARDGVVMVVLQFDMNKRILSEKPEIISRGFVFEKETKDFLRGAENSLYQKIQKKRVINSHQLKTETVNHLEHYFNDKIGRRPMILPVVVEI